MKIGDKVIYHRDVRAKLSTDFYKPDFRLNYEKWDIGIIKEINKTHALVEWQNLNRTFPNNRIRYNLENLRIAEKLDTMVSSSFAKGHNYGFVKGDIVFNENSGYVLLVKEVYKNQIFDYNDYMCISLSGSVSMLTDGVNYLKKIGTCL